MDLFLLDLLRFDTNGKRQKFVDNLRALELTLQC